MGEGEKIKKEGEGKVQRREKGRKGKQRGRMEERGIGYF